MVELSGERVDKILHKETMKKEDSETILRGLYTRYMCLYEKYFADIDALNDERIAALRTYHEETRSLFRYYYLDIPLDICTGIRVFEDKYTSRLLGPGWRGYLFGSFEDFKRRHSGEDQEEEELKAAFSKETLGIFYDAMDYIFREGFGTESSAFKDIAGTITSLLFGKE